MIMIVKARLVSCCILLSLALPGCVTYYHTLPKQKTPTGREDAESSVFYSNVIFAARETSPKNSFKTSNSAKFVEFIEIFTGGLKKGRFNDTMNSNYTTLFEFESAGGINKTNLIASALTLAIIPLRNEKSASVRVRIFHKSGELVREYRYATRHVEWTGVVLAVLSNVFVPGATHDGNTINYRKDSEILYSNFIHDFNVDLKNGVFADNRLSDIKQNQIFTGLAVSGELGDGFSIIQVAPGVLYKGDIKDRLPNGIGSLSDGRTTLSGTWINGKLTGKGKIETPDGSSYTGWLVDSRRNGHGRLVKGNTIVEGEWRDDELVRAKPE